MLNQPTVTTQATLEDQLRAGNQFWSNGQILDAFKVFSEALLAFPDDPVVNQRLSLLMLSRLASRHQKQGNLEGGVTAWNAFLLLDPNNPNAQRALAIALFTLGRAKPAEDLLVPLLQGPSRQMAEEILATLMSIVEGCRQRPDALSQRLFHLASLARKVPAVGDVFENMAGTQLAIGTPVCVAGMHRTGTSMLTRLLGDLGLHLGPQALLHVAQPDNPEGFFENAPIQQLNTDLLAHLGGSWDAPPAIDDSTFGSASLAPFTRRAKLLAAGMATGASSALGWGWKDPRTLLTLPFWLEVLPDTRVVVIFRDPGDVALSLQRRGGYHTPEFGLVLWKTYYDRLFAALGDRSCVVLQYEKFFDDPETEVARLGAFMGWEVTQEKLSFALSHLRQDLRHNHGQLDWRAIPAGKALLPMYQRLLERSVD